MAYGVQDDRLLARSLEITCANHCNLACVGCSHLSPFLKTSFLEPEHLRADLARLATVMHVEVLRLLGGEPLLHPEIVPIARIAKASGIADRIMLTTNGLLLHRMDDAFWDAVDVVLVSRYPGIHLPADFERCAERAVDADVALHVADVPRFRTMLVTRPHPADWLTRLIYRSCKDVHEHHCHMVHEGWLYRCPVPPFLPEFRAGSDAEPFDPRVDGLDIHASENLARDLRTFLLEPRAPSSCSHCLGYLGKDEPHRQLTRTERADPLERPVARETHLDRVRLMRAIHEHGLD